VSDHPQRPGTFPAGDSRRIFVPPPTGGGAPPGTRAPSPNGGGTAAPPRPGYPGGPPRGRERPPGPGGPSRPPGTRPAGPGGRPPGAPRRPWYKRLRWKRVLAIFSVLLVLTVGGLFWWANSIFNRIEKVDVSDALAGGSGGTNYLIVGSDTADVLQPGDPGYDPARPGGQRSDTMLILRFEGGEARIMSIPRDLWATIADTGDVGKINGAYNGGPSRLIRTIEDNLDISIQRYLEVDFVSFAGVVDGLGGITINFEHPAFDTNTGLNVTEAGPVELNGEQALAYVRSRHYTEIIDGEEVEDPRADLGRIERQQAFMFTVFAKLGDARNPIALARVASNVADGLRVDDDMTLFDAMRFAWRLRGLTPSPVVLPTEPDGNGLALADGAEQALDQFR
jgi:LCP family protein required for cell wall assembly